MSRVPTWTFVLLALVGLALAWNWERGQLEQRDEAIIAAAKERRAQIIEAGGVAVFQGCLRDIRDTQRQLRMSNRNVPKLVQEGALSPALARAVRDSNHKRRRTASRSVCERQRERYRETALNGKAR